MEQTPDWVKFLNEEDWGFIKRFLLASGSLKEMAKQYDISYPTVRLRLDRLITKITAVDASKKRDAFSLYVAALVADGTLDPATARKLLSKHQLELKNGNHPNE